MTDNHIKIPGVSPRVQYTANGIDSVFEFSFPIFASDDIQISFNGVIQNFGFLVGGAGDTNGGEITFDSSPTTGTIITISRQVPYERLTDFLEAGDFSASSLNNELDYLTASIQQLERDQGTMLRYAQTENNNPELPSTQNRANKALGFDANGNPIAVDYGLTQSPTNFTAVGTGATQRAVTDKLSDMISVRDFGAVGDGVADDTLAFGLALQSNDFIYIPVGTYRITNTIFVSSNKKIMGAGQGSIIKSDTNLFNAIDIRGGYNILSDFVINGGDVGIKCEGIDTPCVQNRFENLIVQNSQNGILLDGGSDINKPCYWNIFEKCLVLSPNENGIHLTKTGAGDTPNANIFDACRVYSQGTSLLNHGVYVEHGSFYNRFLNCEINVDGTAQSCMTIDAGANETVIDNLYTESFNTVPNIVLKSGSQKTLVTNLLAQSDGAAILDESGGEFQAVNAGFPVSNQFDRMSVKDLNATLMRADTVYIDAPNATQIALNAERSIHLIATTNGKITIDLPLASTLIGATFTFKKIDQTGNEVVISEPNGLGIDRKSEIILGGPYDYATIISNGAEWFITSSNRMAGNTKFYDTNGTLDIDMSVDTYLISSFGGAVTCRLPPANAAKAIGRTITIKKTDPSSNVVNVSEQGGNGPDQYTQPLNAQYNAITVTSNGGQWYVLSKF